MAYYIADPNTTSGALTASKVGVVCSNVQHKCFAGASQEMPVKVTLMSVPSKWSNSLRKETTSSRNADKK